MYEVSAKSEMVDRGPTLNFWSLHMEWPITICSWTWGRTLFRYVAKPFPAHVSAPARFPLAISCARWLAALSLDAADVHVRSVPVTMRVANLEKELIMLQSSIIMTKEYVHQAENFATNILGCLPVLSRCRFIHTVLFFSVAFYSYRFIRTVLFSIICYRFILPILCEV